MSDENELEGMEWDATLDEEQAVYDVLPEGKYYFRVLSMTKGKTKDGKTRQATLILLVKNSDETVQTKLWERLTLKPECKGILASFFIAIGQKQHGVDYQMNWVDVPGSWGRCKVKQEPYKGNDDTKKHNTVNKVAGYLDRDEAEPPAWCLGKEKEKTDEDDGELAF